MKLLTLLIGLLVTSAITLTALEIEVNYTPDPSRSNNPPRVYIAASQKKLPLASMNDWLNLPKLFALVDTDNDGKVTFNDNTPGSQGPLSELATGDYQIQAVVRMSHRWAVAGKGPGDLFSAPHRINADAPPKLIRLTADRRVLPYQEQNSGPYRLGSFRSQRLSAFHKTDYRLYYGVILPQNYDPEKTYPTLLYTFGFGGTLQHLPMVSYQLPRRPARDYLIYVVDANCHGGHSVFCDSRANGPWGSALVKELLPHLDRQFGGAGPAHRHVTGTSSGGWSSLWLQVNYPQAFASCWSFSPDPLDFSAFQSINLHDKSDNNLYTTPNGEERYLMRNMRGKQLSYRTLAQHEHIHGSGGQLHSFSATFSPVDAKGRPKPWFDPTTGAIDHTVTDAWEPYDLSRLIRKIWPEQQQYLRGKIHLQIHEKDTFYLENGVKKFQAACTEVGCDARILFHPGTGHNMTPDGAAKMIEHIRSSWNNARKEPAPQS